MTDGQSNLLQLLLTALLLLLTHVLPSTSGGIFVLEAEQYADDRMAYPRTAASGNWAVHFYQYEVFSIEFCLQSSTKMNVTNVRYSNDGGLDYVEVRLDGQRLDTFTSRKTNSSEDEWNVFQDSGPLGPAVDMLAGKHVLELVFISTDQHGVEIDFVALDIADDDQDERLLQCTAYCDNSINYPSTRSSDSLPSGWLLQRSWRTSCPAQHNVKIEVHHPGLESYQLTAHPPAYRTLLDNRYQGYQGQGCAGTEQNRVLWFFNNFDLLTSAPQMVHSSSSAVLNFDGSNGARNTKLLVQFPSPAFSTSANSSSSRGSVSGVPEALLTLRFRRQTFDAGMVHVLLEANSSRSAVHEQHSTNPSRSDSEVSWHLPQDLWIHQDGLVELELTFVHHPDVTLHVDALRLELQDQEGEEVGEVFLDAMTMVQVITFTSGARAGMTLHRPDNGASWHAASAVTISKKASWSDDMEEIFRLDHRGKVWLKPRSAYASRPPPYGTAVVVGPSDPDLPLPSAPVARVDVDPWGLRLTLTYRDSSVSQISVRSGSYGTRVIVTHVTSVPVRGWPVAVVTSSWVADGKADVDHVSANGAAPREVVGGWGRLYGTSFAFFRQCVSAYNTQAPDVTLELLVSHPDLTHPEIESHVGVSS